MKRILKDNSNYSYKGELYSADIINKLLLLTEKAVEKAARMY